MQKPKTLAADKQRRKYRDSNIHDWESLEIDIVFLRDEIVDVDHTVEYALIPFASLLYPTTLVVVVVEGFVAAFQYFVVSFAAHGEEVCTAHVAVQIASSRVRKRLAATYP